MRRQIDVRRELVGVPAQERVAGIGVDRTQGVVVHRQGQFVQHLMTGQGGVVGFQIQLEVILQAEGAEEVQTSGGVRVVLVLGRFLRLRFDVELPGEPDRLLVIDSHVQEAGEMFQLPLHVGVQKRLRVPRTMICRQCLRRSDRPMPRSVCAISSRKN